MCFKRRANTAQSLTAENKRKSAGLCGFCTLQCRLFQQQELSHMSTQSSHPHSRRFSLRRLPLSMVAAMMFSAALPAVAQTTAAASTEAAAVFKRTDTNGDGKLSKEECQNLPAIAARFDEFDKDKDGFLSMEEFMAAMAAPAK
jgi:hypothetical protein